MRLLLLTRHIQQSNCWNPRILRKGLDHVGSSPLPSLDFYPELQTCIWNCLLNMYCWICNRNLTSPWSFSLHMHGHNPISVQCNSISSSGQKLWSHLLLIPSLSLVDGFDPSVDSKALNFKTYPEFGYYLSPGLHLKFLTWPSLF